MGPSGPGLGLKLIWNFCDALIIPRTLECLLVSSLLPLVWHVDVFARFPPRVGCTVVWVVGGVWIMFAGQMHMSVLWVLVKHVKWMFQAVLF